MSENIIIARWKQFIKTDASSGIILVLSAALALVLANSMFKDGYNSFLEFPVSIMLGDFAISKPLVLWVNDGLMALFFLLLVWKLNGNCFTVSFLNHIRSYCLF